MKKCKKCLQDKDYSEFHKSKGHRDGLYPYCKSIPHTRGDEPSSVSSALTPFNVFPTHVGMNRNSRNNN